MIQEHIKILEVILNKLIINCHEKNMSIVNNSNDTFSRH